MADNYVENHRMEYERRRAIRERKHRAALRKQLKEILERRRHAASGEASTSDSPQE